MMKNDSIFMAEVLVENSSSAQNKTERNSMIASSCKKLLQGLLEANSLPECSDTDDMFVYLDNLYYNRDWYVMIRRHKGILEAYNKGKYSAITDGAYTDLYEAVMEGLECIKNLG